MPKLSATTDDVSTAEEPPSLAAVLEAGGAAAPR